MRIGPDDYYLDGDDDRYRYDIPEHVAMNNDEQLQWAGSLPPCAYFQLAETQEDSDAGSEET